MTVFDWIPLFINPDIVSTILASMRFVQKERQVAFYAYVIVEHHLYLIASASEFRKTMKDFKSFTARTIIDYLEGRTAVYLLDKLRDAKLPHKTKSKYQIWQEGSHPEEIHSEKMFLQKIAYIHNNPVRRGYVEKPKCRRYSSARNNEGLEGLIEVKTDWRNQ